MLLAVESDLIGGENTTPVILNKGTEETQQKPGQFRPLFVEHVTLTPHSKNRAWSATTDAHALHPMSTPNLEMHELFCKS